MSQDDTGKRRRSVRFDEDALPISGLERDVEENQSVPAPLLSVSECSREGNMFEGKNPFQPKVTGKCTSTEPLGSEMRNHMIQSQEPGRQNDFLPEDAFDRLFTEERIAEALARVGCHSFGTRLEVDNMDPNSTQATVLLTTEQLANRRQIIAILILAEKLDTIVDFIKEGIDDSDLPFEYTREAGCSKTLKRRNSNNSLQEVRLFNDWSPGGVDSFENQQWKIHVPVFNWNAGEGRQPPHWGLAPNTTLPYIESIPIGKGGFSAVQRVEIHTSHHDGVKEPKDKAQCYAVKKLEHSNKDEFNKEVSSLSRFISKDNGHPHLIRLLWTFSRGQNYHLVFPCADGNLEELWKSHSEPISKGCLDFVPLWLARQCLGIIEGLCKIHQDDNEIPAEGAKKRHGRHGDLKPENILWFKHFDGKEKGYDLGVLKISDFGLTGFHCTESKSRVNVNKRNIGVSPTYRAPEYDVLQEVAQSYDIWSLACVLLEFVTWYLQGWGAVDRFTKSRAEEHKRLDMNEDTFFDYVPLPNGDGELRQGARAKKAVAEEFKQLYEHENGSDFTIDLLKFIQNKMLRMNPDRRANCTEIRDTFQKFFDECRDNPDYCMERTKKAPSRTNTDNSLLAPEPVGRPGNLFPDQTEEPDIYYAGFDGPMGDSQAAGCITSSTVSRESAIEREPDHISHSSSPRLTPNQSESSPGDDQRVTKQPVTATALKDSDLGLQLLAPVQSDLDGPTPTPTPTPSTHEMGVSRPIGQDSYGSDGECSSQRALLKMAARKGWVAANGTITTNGTTRGSSRGGIGTVFRLLCCGLGKE